MIPVLGILIAAYVFTRMLVLLYPGARFPGAQVAIGISAGLTMITAVLVAGLMVVRGAEIAELLR